jgi:peptidoglycan/LPS O-acetylase OafA/YrhL
MQRQVDEAALLPATKQRPPLRLDVQALRALAVAGVIAYHVWPETFTGGFAGVDVFFVVSGFLVGGALIRQARDSGRLDLLDFSARRLRRLMPASLASVVGILGVSAIAFSTLSLLWWEIPWRAPSLVKDAIASAVGVPNVWFIAQARAYDDASDSPFTHFWSLGVEVQFYILMPALALLMAWALRKSARLGALVGVAVFLLFMAGMLWVTDAWPDSLFFHPVARLWEFWVGVMVALWGTHLRMSRFARHAVGGAAWLLLGVLLWTATATDWPNWETLAPVTATALIIMAAASDAPYARVVNSRPVQVLGDASYSAYLVHWPVIVLGAALLDRPLRALDAVWVLALTAVLTAALYRGIELPVRRVRLPDTQSRKRMLRAAAVATACVVAVAMVVALWAHSSSDVRGATAPPFTAVPLAERPAPVRAFVPVNVRPMLTQAAHDAPALETQVCDYPARPGFAWAEPCVFGTADASAPVVVLFGDSHAAHWFEALHPGALQGDYRLVTLTANDCPPLPGVSDTWRQGGCGEWLAWALDQIESIQPSLVVIGAQLTYSDPQGQLVPASAYVTGYEALRAALPESTTLAWVGGTPTFAEWAPHCAAESPGDITACGAPAGQVLPLEVMTQLGAAVNAQGDRWVDMSDYLCSDYCPVVVDDVFMYRDEDHLTATFARELAAVLQQRLGLAEATR